MSSSHLLVGASAQPVTIEVKRITPTDVLRALAQGLDDFAAMPSHAIFLCVIYPLIGLWLISLFDAAAGVSNRGRLRAHWAVRRDRPLRIESAPRGRA
jgi:uncharacterized membrane protein